MTFVGRSFPRPLPPLVTRRVAISAGELALAGAAAQILVAAPSPGIVRLVTSGMFSFRHGTLAFNVASDVTVRYASGSGRAILGAAAFPFDQASDHTCIVDIQNILAGVTMTLGEIAGQPIVLALSSVISGGNGTAEVTLLTIDVTV